MIVSWHVYSDVENNIVPDLEEEDVTSLQSLGMYSFLQGENIVELSIDA